jgi:hypothetical protein
MIATLRLLCLLLFIGVVLLCRAAPVPALPTIPVNTNRFYFAVTAKNAVGESEQSNEVSVSQTNLTASPLVVTLAWDRVTNATGYALYQGDDTRTYTNCVPVGNVTTGSVVIVRPPPAPRIVRFSMTNGLSITLTNPSGSLVLRPNWRRVTSTTWPVWIEGKTYEPPSEWAMLAGYYTNKTQPTQVGTKISVERL